MKSVILGLAVSGLVATEASAQVTQSYSYDANGRLVAVSTSGGSGTNTATYTYDDANNRAYRTQTGVSAYAMLQDLPAHESLMPHQALTSANGAFTLAVRPSGQLELWLVDGRIESRMVEVFALSPEREARFLVPAGLVVEDARLQLTNNGALTLLDPSDHVLWRSDVGAALEISQ